MRSLQNTQTGSLGDCTQYLSSRPHIAANASLSNKQARHQQQQSLPHDPSKRRALLGLASVAISSLHCQSHEAAWAKPGLLDLRSCSKFKQGGPIQYCDLNQGAGDSPLAGDLIIVDYTARAVATGEVYDGSRNFKFTVGNGEVIPGWELGILGTDGVPPVKEGGLRTVLVPPELAYGKQGDGCLYGLADSCRIPPNSAVEITFKYKGLGY